MKITITPPAPVGTERTRKTNADYNLQLAQVRIHELSMELRVRMGQLMLKGWVFKLVGCKLIEDGTATGNFVDDWWAEHREDDRFTSAQTLQGIIERVERIALP